MSTYIDLSHPICDSMPGYPGDPQVSLQQTASLGKEGYTDFTLSTGMHSGTHLDGPMHLTSSLTRIADLPIGQFAGKGWIFNVVGQKIIDLPASAFSHVTPGSVILFYTGFDLYFGQKQYYQSYPSFSEKTAHELVNKQVKIVGMDSPSPDYEPSNIHNILLSNHIFILENLTNLSSLLPYRKFEILAFPLRIRADSSPVRVVARIE
ncbi:MAG: cyclase family protein [Prolixibacteraceae bacterium]|jgi:kynurenine formamidase|nr:cyclase family protein [Prolixibacteraceae bacterium]